MSQNNLEIQVTHNRQEQRYVIAKNDLWQLECDNKQLPASWIIDLSAQGARVRVGQYRSYKVGDLMAIRIQHNTTTFIDCCAQVKWKNTYAEAVNMDQLGLEFVKSPVSYSKHADKAQMITKNHLLLNHPTPVLRQVQFSLNELTSLLLFPFLIGIVLALVR